MWAPGWCHAWAGVHFHLEGSGVQVCIRERWGVRAGSPRMFRSGCFSAGVWESEVIRMLNTENVGIQCWKDAMFKICVGGRLRCSRMLGF